MPSEFELIRQYFTRPCSHTDLAIGDDAALLHPSSGMQLAISTDMLVAGIHFFADTDPKRLGWKTLAVNLSDLAAMAAQPRWALLSVALPEIKKDWLSAFSTGFFECATQHCIDIIGGDTTAGPLTLNVTIAGEVPFKQAVTRSCARPGDDIWISGQPGLAALGLLALRKKIHLEKPFQQHCLDALEYPLPRVKLGLALRGLVTAMLDISDGLLGDLNHILEQSAVGAIVDITALPLTTFIDNNIPSTLAQQCLLTGGDDYELLFTAPPQHRIKLLRLIQEQQINLTCIGKITADNGTLLLQEENGHLHTPQKTGYQHFT